MSWGPSHVWAPCWRVVTGVRVILMVVVLLSVVGCAQPDGVTTGSAHFASGSPAPATAAPGSRTETAFAKAMYAHQRQAIELDDLALTLPIASLEVRQVATANKREAEAGSQTLRDWLGAWGHAVPNGEAGALGMLSAEQMARVRTADAARFNQLWMQAMIAHHRGAVAMARQVQGSSAKGELLAFAQRVVATHTEEIGRLQMMLANSATRSVQS